MTELFDSRAEALNLSENHRLEGVRETTNG